MPRISPALPFWMCLLGSLSTCRQLSTMDKSRETNFQATILSHSALKFSSQSKVFHFFNFYFELAKSRTFLVPSMPCPEIVLCNCPALKNLTFFFFFLGGTRDQNHNLSLARQFDLFWLLVFSVSKFYSAMSSLVHSSWKNLKYVKLDSSS